MIGKLSTPLAALQPPPTVFLVAFYHYSAVSYYAAEGPGRPFW